MSKTKLFEVGADGLLTEVQKMEPTIYNKALEHGIDVKLIAAGIVKEYRNNSLPIGVSYTAAALRKAVAEADSSEAKGFVVGARDSFGRKSSINIGVVLKNGEHFEVTTWDPKVSIKGVQQEVPAPAVTTMKVVEEEFTRKDNTPASQLKLLAITETTPKNAVDTANMLKPLSMNPSMITDEDCKEYKLVVVKGVISSITPVDIWENKKRLAKPHGIVENNELGVTHPVFVVNLNKTQPEGFPVPTQARITFGQRRFTTPTVLSEDMILLINHAKDKFKDDPVSQSREVGAGMRGTSVICVGTASRLNQSKNKQGELTNYLDISGYLLVEYPEDGTPEESPQEAAPVKKASKKATQAQPKEIGEHIAKIQKYCESFGITPSEINTEKAREILGEGVKVGIVNDVLAQARLQAGE